MNAVFSKLKEKPFGGRSIAFRRFESDFTGQLLVYRTTARSEHERGVGAQLDKCITHASNAACEDDAGVLSGWSEETRQNYTVGSNILHVLLTDMTVGRAQDVVRGHDEGSRDGMKAWYRLKARFALQTGDTYQQVINFCWTGSIENRWRVFRNTLTMLPQAFPDAMLEGIVIKGVKANGAAPHLEGHLRTRAPRRWADVTADVDRFLETFRLNENESSKLSTAPMDIGAVHGATPPKGEERKVSGANKGLGFKGNCFACGKQGHRSANCSKSSKGKGKASGQLGGNTGKGSGAKGMQCYECSGYGHKAVDCANRKAVNQIAQVSDGSWVLVDSGATVSVCPKSFCTEEYRREDGSLSGLRTASGQSIKQYGTWDTQLKCDGGSVDVSFIVSGVREPIVSVRELIRNGYTVTMAEDGACIEKEDARIPLTDTGRLWYLRTKRADNDQRYDIEDEYEANWNALGRIEDDGAEEPVDEDGSGDDARMPRSRRAPQMPNQEEVRVHQITHLPYAAWCESCVAGRSISDASRRVDRSGRPRDAEATLQFDYAFWNARTCLVGVCVNTGTLMADLVTAKGATQDAVKLVTKFIKDLGHTRVLLQGDAEPAIRSLLEAAQQQVCRDGGGATQQVRIRVTSGHASNSNGAVERCIRTLRGLIRTHAHDIEGRMNSINRDSGTQWRLSPSDGLLEYLIRYVAWTHNMYHVPKNKGATAYERLTGRPSYDKVAFRFLQTVQALDDRLGARKAISGRVATGAWLGRIDDENVNLVLKLDGKVVKARTVKICADARMDDVKEWVSRLPSTHTLHTEHAATSRVSQSGPLWVGCGGCLGAESTHNHAPVDASGIEEQPLTAQPTAEHDGDQLDAEYADEAERRDRAEDEQWETLLGQNEGLRALNAEDQLRPAERMRARPDDSGMYEAVTHEDPPAEKRLKVSDFERDQLSRMHVATAREITDETMESAEAEDHVISAVEVPRNFVDKDDPEWKASMNREIESLKSFGVYDRVPRTDVPPGVKVHGARWVHTLKNYQGAVYDPTDATACKLAEKKSRFVVQGWSEDPEQRYASTPMIQSVRTLLVLASLYKWSVKLADVSTAFLHAPVQGEVYVEAPECDDRGENVVWKLRKALYGLRSAPRSWQDHLCNVLKDIGWVRMTTDQSVFMIHGSGGQLQGIIVVYVDDIIAAGRADIIDRMYTGLGSKVLIKHVDELLEGKDVTFLGFKYARRSDGFVVDPGEYVEKILVLYRMTSCKPVSTPGVAKLVKEDGDDKPLEKDCHREFRRAVGQLLWLSVMRRDIQFAVKELSKNVHAPTGVHNRRLKRVLRYLAGTRDLETGIFPTEGDLVVTSMTDADLGGCQDTKRSTSGGVLAINGAVIHSWSKQQATVALSSAEAEYTALARAVSETLFVRNVLQEAGLDVRVPETKCDSKPALEMCEKRAVGRVKHLERSIHFVKEKVQQKEITVSRVSGRDNVADVLTKHVDSATLIRHRGALLGLSRV